MAKKSSLKVRLVPEEKPDSKYYYYAKKPTSGEKAKEKLKMKKCDYIVLNFPTAKNIIFNNLKNNGALLSKSGTQYNLGHVTKTVFANKIISTIIRLENAT